MWILADKVSPELYTLKEGLLDRQDQITILPFSQNFRTPTRVGVRINDLTSRLHNL